MCRAKLFSLKRNIGACEAIRHAPPGQIGSQIGLQIGKLKHPPVMTEGVIKSYEVVAQLTTKNWICSIIFALQALHSSYALRFGCRVVKYASFGGNLRLYIYFLKIRLLSGSERCLFASSGVA